MNRTYADALRRLIVHPELPCPDCGDYGLIAGDSYVDYCHCPAGRLRGRDSLADLQRYDLTDGDRG